MDRVVLLIEATGERISCLLNPESLTFSRSAGLRTRAARGGAILGAAQADDPLILTGGGVTELELQLLFDTDLARSLDPGAAFSAASTRGVPQAVGADGASPAEIPTLPEPDPDVRALTRPLWALAEPFNPGGAQAGAPVVRFIWGRAWNLPAVVTAAAERLERFSPGGTPQRSWLSLRLRRVPDSQPPAGDLDDALPAFNDPGALPMPGDGSAGDGNALYVEVVADADGNSATPLYQLANDHLGGPQAWPLIAAASGIEDPLRIPAGTVLTIPADAPAGGTP